MEKKKEKRKILILESARENQLTIIQFKHHPLLTFFFNPILTPGFMVSTQRDCDLCT